MMTIMGLLFPLLLLLALLRFDWGFRELLPNWLFLLGAFALFWYQTIDAVDGKQARRTDNCSALGQLLDHSNDLVTKYRKTLTRSRTRYSSSPAARYSTRPTISSRCV